MLNSKIIIGTANFGSEYGINNAQGKLTDAAITNICDFAEKNSIITFDTAHGYGDAEVRLAARLSNRQNIITKVSLDDNLDYRQGEISEKVKKFLEITNRQQYHGILIHQPNLFYRADAAIILKELNCLKKEKLVKKIGVSIYSPTILDIVTEIFTPDIVQAPFNIFDQRILYSGWVDKISRMGAELHIRSAFLQGLLLKPRNNLPKFATEQYTELFSKWFAYQKKCDLPADYLAFKFVLMQKWASKIVVGVDSDIQLKRLLEIERSDYKFEIAGLNCDDEGLLNPFNW